MFVYIWQRSQYAFKKWKAGRKYIYFAKSENECYEHWICNTNMAMQVNIIDCTKMQVVKNYHTKDVQESVKILLSVQIRRGKLESEAFNNL